MKVGDTYRDKGITWVWARCPSCLEERAVRRRGPSPLVLCIPCSRRIARRMNDKVWYGIYNKGE